MCRPGHLRKIHLFLVSRRRRRIYDRSSNTSENLNCRNNAARILTKSPQTYTQFRFSKLGFTADAQHRKLLLISRIRWKRFQMKILRFACRFAVLCLLCGIWSFGSLFLPAGFICRRVIMSKNHSVVIWSGGSDVARHRCMNYSLHYY